MTGLELHVLTKHSTKLIDWFIAVFAELAIYQPFNCSETKLKYASIALKIPNS